MPQFERGNKNPRCKYPESVVHAARRMLADRHDHRNQRDKAKALGVSQAWLSQLRTGRLRTRSKCNETTRLMPNDVLLIRKMLAISVPPNAITKLFRVTQQTVSHIRTRQTWRELHQPRMTLAEVRERVRAVRERH